MRIIQKREKIKNRRRRRKKNSKEIKTRIEEWESGAESGRGGDMP